MKAYVPWVMVAVLSVGADRKDASKKDRNELQGYWNVVAVEQDGVKTTPKKGAPVRLIFSGRKVALDNGNKQVYEGKFKTNADAKPKSIDITFLMGPLEGKPLQGIYQLKGDDLVLCWSPSGQKRPAHFTAKAKSGRTLYHLRRGQP